MINYLLMHDQGHLRWDFCAFACIWWQTFVGISGESQASCRAQTVGSTWIFTRCNDAWQVRAWVKVSSCGRRGRGEVERGALRLLMTDSSMQTVSPLGRNQDGGPLTEAEGEAEGSAHCTRWPNEERGSCLQTWQIDQYASTRNHWVWSDLWCLSIHPLDNRRIYLVI